MNASQIGINPRLTFDVAKGGDSSPLNSTAKASFGYLSGADEGTETPIINMPERAEDLLLEQYRYSDNLKKILKIESLRMQEIQYALRDIVLFRALALAFGAMLDGMGEVVGENREGRTDDEYRLAIRVRIFLNSSSGQIEELISLCRSLTNTTKVICREIFPAGVNIELSGASIFPSDLTAQCKKVAVGGVKIGISLVDDFGVFGFEDEGFETDSTCEGFGEVGTSYGGKFAEVI